MSDHADTIIDRAFSRLLDEAITMDRHLAVLADSQLGLSYTAKRWAAQDPVRRKIIEPRYSDRAQDLLWRVANAFCPTPDLFGSLSTDPPMSLGRAGAQALASKAQAMMQHASTSPLVIIVDPVNIVRARTEVHDFLDEISRILKGVAHRVVLVAGAPSRRDQDKAGWISGSFHRSSRRFDFSCDMLDATDVSAMARASGANSRTASLLAAVWRKQQIPLGYAEVRQHVRVLRKSQARTYADARVALNDQLARRGRS